MKSSPSVRPIGVSAGVRSAHVELPASARIGLLGGLRAQRVRLMLEASDRFHETVRRESASWLIGNDLAQPEHDDAVAHLEDVRQGVGHHEHTEPALPCLPDDIQNLGRLSGAEVVGRFIEDDHLLSPGDCAADGNSLPLPPESSSTRRSVDGR